VLGDDERSHALLPFSVMPGAVARPPAHGAKRTGAATNALRFGKPVPPPGRHGHGGRRVAEAPRLLMPLSCAP
ncbi:hypothetical protein, partial [Bacillus mobilis]